MSKLDLYTIAGAKKAAVSLPKAFSEKINMTLLSQAVRVYESGTHPGLSKTKRRGEVQASTRKIYRQKGTGRARHGAKSAPIFVGGGKAHGPVGLKRGLVLPRKMARKALAIALSLKASQKDLIAVENLSSLKKTKEAQKLVDLIFADRKKKKESRLTFILSKENQVADRFLRNLGNAITVPFSTLNAYQVYVGGLVIFDKADLTEKRVTGKKTPEKESEKTEKTKKLKTVKTEKKEKEK